MDKHYPMMCDHCRGVSYQPLITPLPCCGNCGHSTLRTPTKGELRTINKKKHRREREF